MFSLDIDYIPFKSLSDKLNTVPRFGRDPSKLNPKTPKAWDLVSWQHIREELKVNCSFVDFVFSKTAV